MPTWKELLEEKLRSSVGIYIGKMDDIETALEDDYTFWVSHPSTKEPGKLQLTRYGVLNGVATAEGDSQFSSLRDPRARDFLGGYRRLSPREAAKFEAQVKMWESSKTSYKGLLETKLKMKEERGDPRCIECGHAASRHVTIPARCKVKIGGRGRYGMGGKPCPCTGLKLKEEKPSVKEATKPKYEPLHPLDGVTVLYHGTTVGNIPEIKRRGLVKPFLSVSGVESQSYAEWRAEERDDTPIVFKVNIKDINASRLRADLASVSDWKLEPDHKDAPNPSSDRDWQTGFGVSGTVQYSGTISYDKLKVFWKGKK